MNFAEQLKNQLNIVEVVGQYVRLKRQGSGQRWVGLCPFHSEKTPSFGVHSGHQYYRCFGCDAAGDVLKFVQQIESLTFPETLRTLAERYGIPMPARQRNEDPDSQRMQGLLEIHEAAAAVFQENLRSPSGTEARNYLATRGVNTDTAREFRLGYADSSGQHLAHKLRKFGEELLLESGLLAKRSEGSGSYDRFRGRLMFPIHNGSGKIIAFAGRALSSDDKVKYLNSPETKLYTKSAVLYNFHRAKITARKNSRMILVEGYMDAIGIYAAGIQEVAAVCGTALGPNQIRSVKQEISFQAASGHVVLNFDSDAAGARSTEKYISTLLAQNLRVKVLDVPGGVDPDEYIQANGAEAYRNLLETAPSYFQWLADITRRKFDMRTAEGRIDAFKSLLPAVEQVQDRIERAAIATEIAEQLGVNREIVHAAIRQKTTIQPQGRARDVLSAVPPNEKLLVACSLASTDARAVIRHYVEQAGVLEALQLKPIFEAILTSDTSESSFSLSAVTAKLDSHYEQILAAISFSEAGVEESHAAEQALDCLRQLGSKAFQAKCATLALQIREAERQDNLAEAMRLAEELDMLKRSPRRFE